MTRSIMAVVVVLMLAGMAQANGLDDLNAGVAAEKRGDLDAALGSYTRALDSAELTKENQTIAYLNRGLVYGRRGDYDAALRDFNAALRLNPNSVLAYYNRGLAYGAKGDYDAALRDYNAALRLNPNYAAAYIGRGVIHFVVGRFTDAATDFAHGLRIDPKSAYDTLWLHLSRARAGRADTDEFVRNAAAVDRKVWPGLVIAFFLRQLSADQLLMAAESPDGQKRRGQHCQAVFYIGEQEILDQKLGRATQHLKEALDVCPPGYYEHIGAKAELSRVGK